MAAVETQKNTEWRPTRKQAAVLEAAQGSGINRTITAVCEEAGVPRRRFYKWLEKDPNFKRAWEDVWYGTVRRHLPGAIQALAQQAQAGDVQAIKLLAELAGVYKEKKEINAKMAGSLQVSSWVELVKSAAENAAAGRANSTETSDINSA